MEWKQQANLYSLIIAVQPIPNCKCNSNLENYLSLQTRIRLNKMSEDGNADSENELNAHDQVCQEYLYDACLQGIMCKYNHPKDAQRLNAAEKPYRFCGDFFQHQICSRVACRLLHVHREDAERYQRTGELSLGMARAIAALTEGNTIEGIPFCKYFLGGHCNKGSLCNYWHINKEEERRMRFKNRPANIDNMPSSSPSSTSSSYQAQRTNSFNTIPGLNQVRTYPPPAAGPNHITKEQMPDTSAASSFISSFKNKSSAELGKKVVYPPPEFEKLRTMDEVDAFWEFLFSKHKIDEKRRENLLRMIRILQEHRDRLSFKDLNEIFIEKHHQRLTNHFLRNLFATKLLPPGQEIETIKMCIPVFRVERDDVVCYALDDLFEPKNIFISSIPPLHHDMAMNVKVADAVFAILPEQRKMSVLEVMQKLMKTREYKEAKDKVPEAPHLDPVRFVGFLQLYWADVFKLFPEDGQIWIKRHVLHPNKPSQEKKFMKEKMQTQPSFPLPHDILDHRIFVVKVHMCKIPSDGIAFQLLELDNDFKFICDQLYTYYEEFTKMDTDEQKTRRLHPNETFNGTCCLRIAEDKDVPGGQMFRRCQITGQSNGRAMVQDADFPWLGLQDIRNLYKIPPELLGVRQTCVYGVFEQFTIDNQNENQSEKWKEIMLLLNRPKIRNLVRFVRAAERIDYSGRRKFAIFMCTLQASEFGVRQPMLRLPGSL